jgi:hypothetical protein
VVLLVVPRLARCLWERAIVVYLCNDVWRIKLQTRTNR